MWDVIVPVQCVCSCGMWLFLWELFLSDSSVLVDVAAQWNMIALDDMVAH
jgi:hypothetical protein